jgi:Glycosyl transferases group 1
MLFLRRNNRARSKDHWPTMDVYSDTRCAETIDSVGIARKGSAEALRPPRICMPTWRRFAQRAYQCGWYEAEDIISNSDDVDLIHAEPGKRFHFTEPWHRRLMWRDVSRRLAYVNSGLRTIRLTKEYDLLFVHCQSWWELLYFNAIDRWKDHCKTSVCWIDEMYASHVRHYKYWIQSLARFDHVILAMEGTVKAVSEAIGRQCHYVPPAVDALRFTPYPKPPVRVIDAYSIGRRQDQIHRSLLKLAEKNGIFYLYDTLQTGDSIAPDYRQHRDLLANLAKRSRYFLVAPGKIDSPEQTKGQIEVGFRYYEGSAAGAVMLGQAPECESFRRLFNWPDSVIEIKPDGSDVRDVLERLAEQPERLSEISRRNAAEALLRHDWGYRWSEVLEIAGLTPAPALQARKSCLREMAEIALKPTHLL